MKEQPVDDLETRVATKLREALDVCIDDGDGAIDTKGLAQVVIAAVREWDKEQAYEGPEDIPVTVHPTEHVGKVVKP